MTSVLSPEAWASLRDESLSRHLCPHCGGLTYDDRQHECEETIEGD